MYVVVWAASVRRAKDDDTSSVFASPNPSTSRNPSLLAHIWKAESMLHVATESPCSIQHSPSV